MVKVAIGVLGVSLSDLLTWTIYDYKLACEGYELKQQQEWEKIRTISYYSLVSINGSKGINYKDVHIPTDKQEEKKRIKWRKIKA